MKVLSLFDGMSCGQIALNKLGANIESYYASEVDKHAIKESSANFPNTIHIGDVSKINPKDYIDINLVIGGSPCQNFSFAGNRVGMSTSSNEEILTLERYLELKEEGFSFKGQSYLFWEYVRVLKCIQKDNPNVYFLLENVLMIDKWKKIITDTLGVEPIKICSSLVSAQQRKRLYWTNIPNTTLPEDKNIKLEDILDKDIGDKHYKNSAAIRGRYINKATITGRRINKEGKREDNNKKIPIVQCLEVRATNRDKSNCITTVQKDNVLTNLPIGRHIDVYGKKLPYRFYTLQELCRLQTVPDDYFKVSSESQAKKMLGNGWTVDVIAHILKNSIK
jgi:DNA (cytosine-5)-methyltransferase 1